MNTLMIFFTILGGIVAIVQIIIWIRPIGFKVTFFTLIKSLYEGWFVAIWLTSAIILFLGIPMNLLISEQVLKQIERSGYPYMFTLLCCTFFIVRQIYLDLESLVERKYE